MPRRFCVFFWCALRNLKSRKSHLMAVHLFNFHFDILILNIFCIIINIYEAVPWLLVYKFEPFLSKLCSFRETKIFGCRSVGKLFFEKQNIIKLLILLSFVLFFVGIFLSRFFFFIYFEINVFYFIQVFSMHLLE